MFDLHLKVRTEYNLLLLLGNFGNIVEFCPSPLLSSLIRGCLETKRDLYNGGANYTLVGVQFISFSNTVDALYAIKRLCFDSQSATVSLSDLVACLKCDWGYNLQEPFHNDVGGATRGHVMYYSFNELRQKALSFPKFGTSEGASNKDIQYIAGYVWKVTAICYLNPQEIKNEIFSDLKKKTNLIALDFISYLDVAISI